MNRLARIINNLARRIYDGPDTPTLDDRDRPATTPERIDAWDQVDALLAERA